MSGNSILTSLIFGEDMLVDIATQGIVGAFGRKESNQCVVLHLGAALAWLIRGSGKTVPTRGAVYHQAMIARGEEARQAREEEAFIGIPKTAPDQLILSHAHDVLNFGHGRDFRGVFFSSTVMGRIS